VGEVRYFRSERLAALEGSLSSSAACDVLNDAEYPRRPAIDPIGVAGGAQQNFSASGRSAKILDIPRFSISEGFTNRVSLSNLAFGIAEV
jgi:hypothetical protein